MEQIRPAKVQEFSDVQSFYWKLIEEMQASPFLPGWQKGVYPSDAFLLASLKANELYVLTKDSRIAAAMVLNHEYNEGYEGTHWGIDAAKDEVMVIHALGVLPELQGAGLAKALVREAVRLAGESRQKAIRLDVLDGNLPALRLYESMGFCFRRGVQMFYEDTGWTKFLLFELPL